MFYAIRRHVVTLSPFINSFLLALMPNHRYSNTSPYVVSAPLWGFKSHYQGQKELDPFKDLSKRLLVPSLLDFRILFGQALVVRTSGLCHGRNMNYIKRWCKKTQSKSAVSDSKLQVIRNTHLDSLRDSASNPFLYGKELELRVLMFKKGLDLVRSLYTLLKS